MKFAIKFVMSACQFISILIECSVSLIVDADVSSGKEYDIILDCEAGSLPVILRVYSPALPSQPSIFTT